MRVLGQITVKACGFLLLLAIIGSACSSIADKQVAPTSDLPDSTFHEEHFYSYVGEDQVSIDTIISHESASLTLSIVSYCLNDSALVVTEERKKDGNRQKIYRHFHNGRIQVDVAEGEEIKYFEFDKMLFAGAISKQMVMECPRPWIDLLYVDASNGILVLSALFCVPETDDCYDAVAIVNYKSGELISVNGHGGFWCDSEVQFYPPSYFLTCEGLYTFSGNELVSFEGKHVVMAERFDYNHFLLVVDPIISQEWSVDENGNKRYSEERDEKSDNAFALSTEGDTLFTFRYDGFYQVLGYQSPSYSDGFVIYLFDFQNGIYIKVDGRVLIERNWKQLGNKINGRMQKELLFPQKWLR